MSETQNQQNTEVVQDITQVIQDWTAFKAAVSAYITAVGNTAAAADPAVTAALQQLVAMDADIVSTGQTIPSQTTGGASGTPSGTAS